MIVAYECDWTKGFEPSDNQSAKIATWRCNENSTWEKTPLRCIQSGFLRAANSKVVSKQVVEADVAAATGSVILGILGFFISVIVCLDYMTLSRDIRQLRHNVNAFMKRMRDQGRAKQLHVIRKRLRNTVKRQDFLKQLEELREKQRLEASGLANGKSLIEMSTLVANPLSAGGKVAARSADEVVDLRHAGSLHVDGEMELPEDITLRLGLTEPGTILAGSAKGARH